MERYNDMKVINNLLRDIEGEKKLSLRKIVKAAQLNAFLQSRGR